MQRLTPERSAEYRLTVQPLVSENNKTPGIRLILESTRLFARFPYALAVDEQKEGNCISLRIRGLQPPPLSLTAAGHARHESKYHGLQGVTTVMVERMDGRKDRFDLEVAGTSVRVLTPPSGMFTDITVEPEPRTP